MYYKYAVNTLAVKALYKRGLFFIKFLKRPTVLGILYLIALGLDFAKLSAKVVGINVFLKFLLQDLPEVSVVKLGLVYTPFLLYLGVYLSTSLLNKEPLGLAFPRSVTLLNGLKLVFL